MQYTTGVGVGGGALLNGMRGALFKGWTFTSQLTTGSGLPLTPVYLTPVPAPASPARSAPICTGASTPTLPGGLLSESGGIRGAGGRPLGQRRPQLDPRPGAVLAERRRRRGRSCWGDRLNLDWRIDATNVLNRVTYASVNTIVGSPQFGLPIGRTTMRKVQTSLRLRF